MERDAGTRAWWTFLRLVSVFNIGLLGYTAVAAPVPDTMHRAQLGLAAIYTVVCAFRSFFPRVDLERTVMVDHWLSSIVLGRTSATIAEMAFTVQCALFLVLLDGMYDIPWLSTMAWIVVPLIAVAQICCWLGVVTLNHLWHAAEEFWWALFMGMLGAAFVAVYPVAQGVYATLLPIGLVSCAGGAFVMAVLDIPMYIRRNREEVEKGTVFLSVPTGFRDALHRRAPTGSWDVWKHEVAWMTPYFSGGVWLSILLVWL